jgi:hypothetical protein
MSKPALPDDLGRFILTRIPSVPYAEAMLLMRRNPATSWDAQRLARLLYVSDVQALDLLRRLFEAGFVTISEDGTNTLMGRLRRSLQPNWTLLRRLTRII